MSLTVTPLRVGTLEDFSLANVLYGQGREDRIDMIVYMFVIEGGPSPIVVDTGTFPPEYVNRHHPAYRFVREHGAEPAAVLRAHGVEPDDVEIVVNTHLHWDHSSNNALFGNASVIVQRKELEYAVDPLPVHRRAYEKLPGLQAPWMAAWDRTEAINGESTLAPGVTAVPLPGHSPGSQGVLVETATGRYLIAGDAVDIYESWDPSSWQACIPPGIHTNVFECYETFERVAALNCEVIPSHDGRVLENAPFGA